MAKAICIRCGAKKPKGLNRCRSCGLDPKSDNDLALKSVYLSIGRFTEDEERQQLYERELDAMSQSIREGTVPEFADADLQRLARERELVKALTPKRAAYYLFRTFLPAFLLLGILYAIMFALKAYLGK